MRKPSKLIKRYRPPRCEICGTLHGKEHPHGLRYMRQWWAFHRKAAKLREVVAKIDAETKHR